MSSTIFDVIVLGVGGMGSAAACELASRGQRVLALEQFAIGHDLGSSHGHTRIIRQAYYEHPDYVPLVRRAYDRWYDLEQRQGIHLLTQCDCLSIGRSDSELIQGVQQSAREHGIPIENLSANDRRSRFPQFQFSDEYVAIVERSAGFLDVEQCILAHVCEARRRGAEIHDNEQVLGWQATPLEVSAWTTKGTYKAAKLVITAGSWASSLLARHGAALTLMRQVPMWFGTRDDSRFRRDVFPLYIVDAPGGYFYGFPVLDGHGAKVAQHYGAAESFKPEEIAREVTEDDEKPLRAFLRDHIPDINGPRHRSAVCIYTLTPDRHFVLDTHPDHANVAIAAGFSGHGFKFASVVGEILADLADCGHTKLPIRMFRIDRFSTQAS